MQRLKIKWTAIVAGSALVLMAVAAAAVRSARHSVPPIAASSSATASSSSQNANGSGASAAGANGQGAAGEQVIRFVKDPEPAPPFNVKDLNGKPISNADWKGKVVIVNFWATWCGPCRIEIPILESLQARYKDQLEIIGVSVDEDPPAKILAFTKQQGMNYRVAMSNPVLNKTYGGDLVLPTAFIIDKQGRVVQKHTGVYSEDLYDTEIRALLGMPINAKIETFEDVGQVMLKNVAKATSLPGVSFAGLTEAQRKEVLHRLNAEKCTCGCDLTLAQCRLNDDACPVSLKLAAQVVADVKAGKPAPPPVAQGDSANP